MLNHKKLWSYYKLKLFVDIKGKYLDHGVSLAHIYASDFQYSNPEVLSEYSEVFLELGSYIGYSTVRLASQLSNHGRYIVISNKNYKDHNNYFFKFILFYFIVFSAYFFMYRLISIDISPTCTSWTKLLLNLTNLENKVDLYTGTLTDVINHIKLKYKYINLIFLDHDKNNYLSDLLKLESSGNIIYVIIFI